MQIVLRNDSVLIDGYVNAVGRESRPLRDSEGYFTETIQPGAFARALTRGSRQMLLNHDSARILGKEGENLELREDGVGLFAHAQVSDSETIEKAKARELRGWSFGFKPLKQRFEDKDGMRHRIVEDMELYEVSLIDSRKLPAYAATSVFTRDAGDAGEVEYRTMDMQDVEVVDTRSKETIDYSPYASVLEKLRS